MVRLNSDGTEDTAFYTNMGAAFNGVVRSIAIQSDGKILVGGDFTDFGGNTRNGLVRLNSDGTEDTAFYTNMGAAFNNGVRSIAIQSNGQILVGGKFNTFNSNTRNSLVRLNSDGIEDSSFYTNMGIGFDDGIYALALNDISVIVGGAFSTFNGISRYALTELWDFHNLPSGPSGTSGTSGLAGERSFTWIVSNPGAGDILGPRLNTNFTPANVYAYTMSNTNIVFNIYYGAIQSTSTLISTNMTAGTSGNSSTSFSANPLAGHWLVLHILSISGTPGQAAITIVGV